MYVRMTFTVDDDRYQLVRTVAQDKHGAFGAKETWLRKIDDEGKVLTHVDQVRKVDAAVRALLGGMDREQFCQAVLLAQNRFAALLEADPRKREALLDTLLGLTALLDARKALQTTAKAAQRNIDRLEERRANVPEDPASEATKANARARAMAEVEQRASESAERLTELSGQAEDLHKQATELDASVALRAGASGPDGLTRLAGVLGDLEELESTESRLQVAAKDAAEGLEKAKGRREKALAALTTTEDVHGQVGTHDVVATQLGQLQDLLSEQPSQEAQLVEAASEVSRLEPALEVAMIEAAKAQSTADEKRKTARIAREEAQAKAEALARRQEVAKSAGAACKRMATQDRAMGSAVTELNALQRAISDADAKLTEATKRRVVAARDLANARQGNAAAAAAHGVHVGEPCPVCDRTLPEGWVPPDGGDLDVADQAFREVEEALEKAADEHRAASQNRAAALSTLRAALAEFATAHQDLVTIACENAMTAVPASRVPLELAEDDAASNSIVVISDAVSTLGEEVATWGATVIESLSPLNDEAQAAGERAKATGEELVTVESARGCPTTG